MFTPNAQYVGAAGRLSPAEVGFPAVDPQAHSFHRVSVDRPRGVGRRGPRLGHGHPAGGTMDTAYSTGKGSGRAPRRRTSDRYTSPGKVPCGKLARPAIYCVVGRTRCRASRARTVSLRERERETLVLCPAERRDKGRRGTRTVVRPLSREEDAARGKQVCVKSNGRGHWLGRIGLPHTPEHPNEKGLRRRRHHGRYPRRQ